MTPEDVALVVIAKAPVPGRVKTRLCPPCSPEQAAAIAEASLRDTLDAVAATTAGTHVIALDGSRPDWIPSGFTVLPQRGAGLDERLAAALTDVDGPAVIVGMDTPQVTPQLLSDVVAALCAPGVDAVLGPAVDGGYWTIGLREPDPDALVGVPMSVAHTCRAQRRRLEHLSLRTVDVDELTDVDTWADALALTELATGLRYAGVVRGVDQEIARAALT